MLPALAAAWMAWRENTPCDQDAEWVFASPFTKGKRPYCSDSASGSASCVLPGSDLVSQSAFTAKLCETSGAAE